ncbi:hypothetical protein ACFQV8_07070 [Pseudonocardia benzenivorans]
MPRALRPFRRREYRLLVSSMAASLFATGIWLVAIVWQVIALGGGPAQLSVVAAANSGGLLLSVLVGGVAADRLRRRLVLCAVEAVRLAPDVPAAAAAAPGATATGTPTTAAGPATAVASAPRASVVADLGEGFRYLLRTGWRFATLAFAVLYVLVVLGPIEVLLPFAVRDRTGAGPSGYATVLGAYGVGGAVGSIITSSLRMPRRYLTTMILLGAGATVIWVVVVALVVGAARPGVEPGLLRLARTDAGLDGVGRTGRRGVGHPADVRAGRNRPPAAHGGRDRRLAAAPRRGRAPPRPACGRRRRAAPVVRERPAAAEPEVRGP